MSNVNNFQSSKARHVTRNHCKRGFSLVIITRCHKYACGLIGNCNRQDRTKFPLREHFIHYVWVVHFIYVILTKPGIYMVQGSPLNDPTNILPKIGSTK